MESKAFRAGFVTYGDRAEQLNRRRQLVSFTRVHNGCSAAK